jgi:hypothetical protein
LQQSISNSSGDILSIVFLPGFVVEPVVVLLHSRPSGRTIRGRFGREKQSPRVDETIQIVLRLYDSVTEVLFGFDCDCCCCAFDGRSVWASDRLLHALRTGVNVLNPLHAWPNRPSYELRLSKYAYRGFPVAVPGLDEVRIDWKRIRATRLQDLKGLARFLKIAPEMETAPDRETISFPQHPSCLQGLRRHVLRDVSTWIKVSRGGGFAYDEIGEAILPSVFLGGSLDGLDWLYIRDTDIPIALECHNEAWSQIENAVVEEASSHTARLLDAWDQSKRSREYLNGDTDKYLLDNLYYNEAYVKKLEKKK